MRVGGMTGPGGESIAERFAVLAELRAEGLIRHLGVSDVDAAQLAEARSIAPVAVVQNRHTGDLGLVAESEDAGIAYVPYFTLGGGVGSGPLGAERLSKVAARLGATPAQVAIASLLATSPTVLAIPGTGSLEHLEENLAANDLSLTDEDLSDLRGQRASSTPLSELRFDRSPRTPGRAAQVDVEGSMVRWRRMSCSGWRAGVWMPTCSRTLPGRVMPFSVHQAGVPRSMPGAWSAGGSARRR